MTAPNLNDPEIQAAGRRRAKTSLNRLARRSKLAQCLELQEVLKNAVLNPDVNAKDKASMVLAWDRLEDRIRILRGKPLPGSLQPAKTPKNLLPRGISSRAVGGSAIETEFEPEIVQQGPFVGAWKDVDDSGKVDYPDAKPPINVAREMPDAGSNVGPDALNPENPA